MFLPTQPYKGSRDFYPEAKRVQDWIFGKCRDLLHRYGFQEYDGPMLESFELYAAKSGTELVNQQLYILTDRGDRKLAIRPEMTPTLARMVAARLQELPKPIRWFSIPNLWRYERPQRGRTREHWQLNVDILGGQRELADLEILLVASEILGNFGATQQVQVRINHRKLIDYLFKERLGLDDERALKLTKLIDAKAKMEAAAYDKALSELQLDGEQRKLIEVFFQADLATIERDFPCEGQRELSALHAELANLGAEKRIFFDPTIMRGLDYYTGLVFEAFDVSPENNRAMFGGGRYDNLIGLFGKQQLSGVGFGMGDVVLRDFLETHKLLPKFGSFADVLVTCPSKETLRVHLEIAHELRKAGLRVITPLSVDSFAAQLKLAAKHGIPFAIILGEEELKAGELGLKDLRNGGQRRIPRDKLPETLRSLIQSESDQN